MEQHELSRRARAVAAAIEPVAGQVYFSPECHANYEALGFDPSPGEFAGVPAPEMQSYFCSRGSLMGQVHGEVIAAAFGVFNHDHVVRAVRAGWDKTDAATICRARDDGAVGQLRRILGDEPEGVHEARSLLERACADLEPYGKPLYAGVVSQPRFDDPLADCWRLADRLREYRGDAHTSVWTSVELDACQIGLLSELYWGLPARSYSRTRMWSDEQYDAAEDALEGRGLVVDQQLTDGGLDFRRELEARTDRQCKPIVDALGDDLDQLVHVLGRWSDAIRVARGYPAAGPHDLAGEPSGP